MLTQEQKSKLIKEYKLHEKDTGSAKVQIALLTEEINKLLSHLKKHRKDFHSKRGLLKMVAKRRSLLSYLQKENSQEYTKLIKKLDLRK